MNVQDTRLLPGLYAVDDPDGVTMQLRPARFTKLASGRVGVIARPGMRRTGWLISDLLTELGCSDTVTGAGRPGEGNPTQLITWLRINDISDVYVQFAWDLPFTVLDETIDIAKRAECALWLVGDTPLTDDHREFLTWHRPTYLTAGDFLGRWAPLTTGQPSFPPGQERGSEVSRPSVDEQSARWPDRVPEDDFTTFRHTCRQLLTPAAFALVDERLRTAHDAACRDLVPTLVAARQATDSLDERGVTPFDQLTADWLGQRWEEAGSVDHFVVITRGAQVALFRAGFHAAVDLDQMIATTAAVPVRAVNDPATWERLRAYSDPQRPTVCALSAAGVSFATIATLPVRCYDHGSGAVTLPSGATVTVPEPARVFVRAQQIYQRLSGASDHDLLVSNRGVPVAPRTLATMVKVARRETGAAVAAARADQVPVEPGRVSRRLGVTVRSLG